MKIPPLSDVFARIASSKRGEKFYKKILDPKLDGFWDTQMPVLETSIASTAYIINTQVQKNIDDRSKKALQIQNVLSWGTSVAISIPMNKKLNKFTKEVEKHLKPDIMQDFHKVSKGLSIALPLLAVTVLNRALIPSLLVPISSVIRNKHDEYKKNKLDIKA